MILVMNTWIVPLVVGSAGAVASVLVGLLTYRQSRRDARDNIKRDIELYNLLPPEWGCRKDIQWYIEDRASNLSVKDFASKQWRFYWIFMTPGTIAAISVGMWSKRTHGAWNSTLMVGLTMLWFAGFMLLWALGSSMYEKAARKDIAKRRSQTLNQGAQQT